MALNHARLPIPPPELTLKTNRALNINQNHYFTNAFCKKKDIFLQFLGFGHFDNLLFHIIGLIYFNIALYEWYNNTIIYWEAIVYSNSIKIFYEGGLPIYRQIVNQIKQLIASGHLSVGCELLPIRKLAQSIEVNPNTVDKAYKELEHQGVIYTKQGAGCFVADKASPLSEQERTRILSEYVQQLLTQVYQLNFSYADIIKELDNQMNKGG